MGGEIPGLGGEITQHKPSPLRALRGRIQEFSAGDRAHREIMSLGVRVSPDSEVGDVMQALTTRPDKPWRDDKQTREYVQLGIGRSEALATARAERELPSPPSWRVLTVEPHATGENQVFLGISARDALHITPDDAVKIRLGDKVITAKAMRPRVRDDGRIEGANAVSIRVSPDVLGELGVPKGYAVGTQYDAATKEIRLIPEASDASVVKVREPCTLSPERGRGENQFFLSVEDQVRFGVKPGERIAVCFGKFRQEVTVVDAGVTGEKQSNWRLSGNVLDKVGLPADFAVRSKYDKGKKEFSLGPSLVVFGECVEKDGVVVIGQAAFSGIARAGREYGVPVIAINPNTQNPNMLRRGYVQGWMSDKHGGYRKVQIPVPDVLYDKMESLSDVGMQVRRSIQHSIIPEAEIAATGSKSVFADLLQRNGLGENHPATMSLRGVSVDSLAAFFQEHPSVILKPINGSAGKGILFAYKREDGAYVMQQKTYKTGGVDVSEVVFDTPEAFIKGVGDLEKVRGSDGLDNYIMQEKIDFAEYHYADPLTGEQISGSVEPRVVVQRGIDGKVRIGGMVGRLMNEKARGIPHKQNFARDVARVLTGGNEEEVERMVSEIERLSLLVYAAVEGEMHGEKAGEMTIDIGIRKDGRPIILEVNAQAAIVSIFSDAEGGKPDTMDLPDARLNVAEGPIEYALALTDMN